MSDLLHMARNEGIQTDQLVPANVTADIEKLENSPVVGMTKSSRRQESFLMPQPRARSRPPELPQLAGLWLNTTEFPGL